jgi:hypothetical protein
MRLSRTVLSLKDTVISCGLPCQCVWHCDNQRRPGFQTQLSLPARQGQLPTRRVSGVPNLSLQLPHTPCRFPPMVNVASRDAVACGRYELRVDAGVPRRVMLPLRPHSLDATPSVV